MSDIEAEVRKEIEALHHFFVGWFSGQLPESEFDSGFSKRFDPEFILIPPAGSLLPLGDLASGVRKAHATNPEFRIAIRNVKLRRILGDHVLATYEEWQRNALASTPPNNARLASVIFRREPPLHWLHVHETWMPAGVAAAGPYDF